MSSFTDDEWTILIPTTSHQTDMDTTAEKLDKADTPTRECIMNVKSSADAKKHFHDCTCDVNSVRARRDSFDSSEDEYRRPRRAGRIPPPPPPQPPFPPAPPRPYQLPSLPHQNSTFNSSTQLLDKVGQEDGVIRLPSPATRNIYLTTYPFGDRDVKKWAWLLASGIEDEYVKQNLHETRSDMPSIERVKQRRSEFPVYDPGNVDIPSVYLSRCLDPEVISDDTDHNLRYYIVTQTRHRPAGFKLLVAESRKAVGVQMYYEALRGESVLFVGATVHQCKNTHSGKYKKVSSLEEAISVQEEGFVGVIC